MQTHADGNKIVSVLMKSLKVDPDMKSFYLDFVWCLCTVLVTFVLTALLDSGTINQSNLVSSVSAGALSAIVYLQFITITVYAVAYMSPTVRSYRSLIVALAVIVSYLIARLIASPEAPDTIYSYSASIATVMVIIVKLKSIVYLLVEQSESNDLVKAISK